MVKAITEGDVVQFTISTDREIDTRITINVNITQSSNFVTWRLPRTVAMPAGKKAYNHRDWYN